MPPRRKRIIFRGNGKPSVGKQSKTTPLIDSRSVGGGGPLSNGRAPIIPSDIPRGRRCRRVASASAAGAVPIAGRAPYCRPKRTMRPPPTPVAAAAAWFCAAVAAVAAGLDYDDRMPPPEAFRLPADTAPESYDLRFELGPPDAVAGPTTFGGVARIAVRAVAAARVVTLHVKDLTVGEVTVTGPDDGDGDGDGGGGGDRLVAAARLAYRPHDEQLDVHLSAAMTPGRRYRVTVAYEGRVRRDAAVGLFAKSYRVGDATK